MSPGRINVIFTNYESGIMDHDNIELVEVQPFRFIPINWIEIVNIMP
jgi:hypothetical protein